jgi:hypothetical protein
MADDIEIVKTCPLGSTCKRVVDGKIEQCMWLTNIKGVDLHGTEQDQFECAITWMPIIGLEISGQARGTNASIQSLRNNMENRQKEAIKVIKDGVQKD